MNPTQTTPAAATAILITKLVESIAAFGERIALSDDPREIAQLKSYREQTRRVLTKVQGA